jgi:hypothetical protein
MSRFEELCNSANDAIVADFRFKEGCNKFASELTTGLLKNLEVPEHRAWHYRKTDSGLAAPARFVEEAAILILMVGGVLGFAWT